MLTETTSPLAQELEAVLRLIRPFDTRSPTVRLVEIADALERADDPRLAALGAYLAPLAEDIEAEIDAGLNS